MFHILLILTMNTNLREMNVLVIRWGVRSRAPCSRTTSRSISEAGPTALVGACGDLPRTSTPAAWVRRRRDGAGAAPPPAGDWWPRGAAQPSSLGASPSDWGRNRRASGRVISALSMCMLSQPVFIWVLGLTWQVDTWQWLVRLPADWKSQSEVAYVIVVVVAPRLRVGS